MRCLRIWSSFGEMIRIIREREMTRIIGGLGRWGSLMTDLLIFYIGVYLSLLMTQHIVFQLEA